MVLSILVILGLVAIGFFHYIQGFFSATLSAILSIVSAVIALSFQESLIEGPLSGVSPEWIPPITLMFLFAIVYVILRTIFDKVVPGNIRVPAIVDKIGGGVMGLVAAAFAVGIIVIALQQMPLGPSLAGYTRFETDGQRNVTATVQVGNSYTSIRAKDAATFNEMTADHFDRDKANRLIVPVDDIVVSTVAHLSDNGSLQAGKPLRDVHPAYLDELFGQRLGVQFGGGRTAINADSKNKSDVTVDAVYEAPAFEAPNTVDQEFKKMRASQLSLKPVPGDERRIVVRVKFAETAADKDKLIRLSPAAVRLVAHAPEELDPTGEPQPRNYFPIGTREANGMVYLDKIDDPLFITAKGRKADGGGDGPAQVDFIFQVKEAGFIEPGSEKTATPKIADGTFIEVKKFARVDLSGHELKPKTTATVPVLAILRKHLEWEAGGPPPPEPGKLAAAAPAQPIAVAPAAAATPAAPAAAPAAPAAVAPAPDANMSKLIGTWENDAGLSYTFRGDGSYSGTQAAVGDAPAKSGGGTWKVTGVENGGGQIKIELANKSGKNPPAPQTWDVSKSADGELQRVDKKPPIAFKRKG